LIKRLLTRGEREGLIAVATNQSAIAHFRLNPCLGRSNAALREPKKNTKIKRIQAEQSVGFAATAVQTARTLG
jgi:hypothetical protein